MAYFRNASTQLLENLDLFTKIMFGYHGNNKLADFYKYLSENQQLYHIHEKLSTFLFILSKHTECVVRYYLFKKIFYFQV